ncbi:hypothetical protein [Streptomyces nigra]|uniref:hypothetical protein n=1 Tax=Streptomyces nigra TaxID=1827580 RepID=UPI000E1CCD49|nr:hypothetical protein DWC19_01245 [Streptomyces sp. M7]
MRITRRLDTPTRCATNSNCPAVFALASGDVAFIGRVAPELRGTLPAGSGVGDGEHLVVVPRDVLISAGWTPPTG